MQKQKLSKSILIAMSAFALMTAACANANEGQQTRNQGQDQWFGRKYSVPSPPKQADVASIPLVQHEGHAYLSLDELVNTLEFTHDWDEQKQVYKIGNTDVIYEVFVHSTVAKKASTEVDLGHQPYLRDGRVYVPLEIVGNLFQEGMNYAVQNDRLLFYPVEDDGGTGQNKGDFADDPLDPANIGDAVDEEDALNIGDAGDAALLSDRGESSGKLTSFSHINVNRLIATGKKYLGVKYEFGADSYEKSGTFDCSSFVQQLYGTYGINLPRTARDQAKVGVSVSRSNLRKGDLLFFSVPGRFRSNNTVGHVGIYIGGGQMLHSSPSPKNGVQISNINNEHWKDTYLGARRVINH